MCQTEYYKVDELGQTQCVAGIPHIPDDNFSPGLFLLLAPLLLGCVLCYTARLVWLARLDHHRWEELVMCYQFDILYLFQKTDKCFRLQTGERYFGNKFWENVSMNFTSDK